MIGKIERVPLREVWRHEAFDFTQWLQDNIDVLNNVIDLNLSNPEREQAAGSFNIDIVAEDDAGNPVIIENQLEKSDHDHLGKILTYLVAMGAKSAIWIVSNPRPEHISAISWLNESSAANFYLLKIEAIKIENSPPAPLLTVIVGPSEEAKEVGKAKKEIAERYIIREKFWTQLLDLAKQKTKLHSNISPTQHNWLGTSAGRQGLGYNYVLRKDGAQVELYIDRGKGKDSENKAIFEKIHANKEKIEKDFGEPLEWERLEGKRACRISKRINIGGYRDPEENWPNIHEAMVDAMIRLEKSMKPHIAKLNI
ncbi:MAG: DUF4268 domain-containing protein [Deltaproteobacteria bacterium]|nr:MAG: DUF4268 domain-containing protein [Deltaproteobacteria bacterium]